jgi:2-C-methyl-D-erythritol 4-phosphate cytidylyltransferase
MEKKLFAIIVAGGSGSRMKSNQPKQFLRLAGIPILMHTVKAYYSADPAIEILIVLPVNQISYWKNLCDEMEFLVPHQVVGGGQSRGESVVNGLNILPSHGLVAIHDGVRPFVSDTIIKESYKVAERKGCAVAAVDMKDSIRVVNEKGSQAIDRSLYKIVQTPQTFQLSIIKEAYKKVGSKSLSDDATVAELAGYEIHLVEGSYDNIKITTPEDLIFAEKIVERLKL